MLILGIDAVLEIEEMKTASSRVSDPDPLAVLRADERSGAVKGFRCFFSHEYAEYGLEKSLGRLEIGRRLQLAHVVYARLRGRRGPTQGRIRRRKDFFRQLPASPKEKNKQAK